MSTRYTPSPARPLVDKPLEYGTGLMSVTDGLADVPVTLVARVTADAVNLRSAMGLGGSATLDVGTGSGDVAAGDHTHTLSALGATTIGAAIFGATDPSAITFPRANANNTVSFLSAADFRTALGVGTGNSPTFTGLSVGNGLVSAPSINLGDSTTGFYRSSANRIAMAFSGVKMLECYASGIVLESAKRYMFVGADTSIGRNSAGVVEIGTSSSAGFAGSLKLTNIESVGTVTVTGLLTANGGAKIGDGTNYTQFEADGTLVMVGTATVFDDLLPRSHTAFTGSAAPNVTLMGGSSIIKAQEFANISASEEFNPCWQLPHAWKEGSVVVPHLHLYVPDDGTGGVIEFQMVYAWQNVDSGTMTESSPILGTITRAANAGINGNALLSFGDIAGTGKTVSSLFSARIMRTQGGNDTFGGTCWLRSADLHYEMDTLGSRSITTK